MRRPSLCSPRGPANPLFGQPLEASFEAAENALHRAISTRGWYSDFSHWSTPTGSQLFEYFSRQSAVMASSGARVASASYGDAVSHRFLRDSIQCTASESAPGSVVVRTTFTAAYPGAPLAVVRQPVALVLDTTGSSLEGGDVTAAGARVQRLGPDRYVLHIPFSPTGSTVTLKKAAGASYLPARPPVVSTSISNGVLSVRTDRPTKAVLFVASADLPHANAADVIWRSSSAARSHRIDLRAPGLSPSAGASVIAPGRPVALWVGVIGAEGHSTATRATAPTSAVRLLAGSVGSPAYRTPVTLTARLTDAAYAPLPRQVIAVERYVGGRWTKVTAATPVTGHPGRYVARVLPYADRRTLFRFRYRGMNGTYRPTFSRNVPVVPHVRLPAPSVRRVPYRREFIVRGLLAPRHAERTRPIVLQFYRYERTSSGTRRWVRRREVAPRLTDIAGGSRYSARVSLPSRGQWLVRAVHRADGAHAATISSSTRFSLR